ncbi:MAG TPA: branched-chain amino acid ABC transporter permease [Nitrososphaerales archaeon]|nr:branched-chain amino acid ABC transporter permease [Nitrososphaerales archaeon]
MFLLTATDIVTILIQGILFGGILSMMAVGLTLIFGVTRVLNIAHGDFLVLGGITAAILFEAFGLNPFLTLVAVVPLFAVIGVLFSFLMRKPMSSRTAEVGLASSVLVTLGLSNLIEGLGVRIAGLFGYNTFAIPGSALGLGTITIGGVTLTTLLVISFVIIVAISVGMTVFVYRTSFGALMRASMSDREAAIMLGADVSRVSIVTFAIGIALASLGGTIIVMVGSLDPNSGLPFTIDALTVVVLGGLGSFYGALIGGFIIGLSQGIVQVVLTIAGLNGGAWVSVVPLVILIIILIIKPTGLLKR